MPWLQTTISSSEVLSHAASLPRLKTSSEEIGRNAHAHSARFLRTRFIFALSQKMPTRTSSEKFEHNSDEKIGLCSHSFSSLTICRPVIGRSGDADVQGVLRSWDGRRTVPGQSLTLTFQFVKLTVVIFQSCIFSRPSGIVVTPALCIIVDEFTPRQRRETHKTMKSGSTLLAVACSAVNSHSCNTVVKTCHTNELVYRPSTSFVILRRSSIRHRSCCCCCCYYSNGRRKTVTIWHY